MITFYTPATVYMSDNLYHYDDGEDKDEARRQMKTVVLTV